MPCPKGFKHAQKYPRPNRQRPAAGVCLTNIPTPQVSVSESHEDQINEEILPTFNCLDVVFLQAIGIFL